LNQSFKAEMPSTPRTCFKGERYDPVVRFAGLEHGRRNGAWYLVRGILLIILGATALAFPLLTTLASVLVAAGALRRCGPKQAIRGGSWAPPSVKRVK
jgi:hypothetical protein